MIHSDNNVTATGIVLWDGITRPEEMDGGGFKHSIRIAIPDNAPELQELNQVATTHLQTCPFQGVLPPGGNWPFMGCDVSKFGPLVAGRTGVTGVTYNGAPTVFDINGQVLPFNQIAGVLYPGAEVEVIFAPRDYNNKQKGIGFWVSAVKSINATLPKLDVGSGISNDAAANMFAQTAGAHPAPQAGAVAPPPQAGAVVQPNPAFTQGPAHNMLPAAGGVPYEQWIAQGWTDATLIANGYMTA